MTWSQIRALFLGERLESPHQIQSRKALNPNERKNRIARTEIALSMKVLCILHVDVKINVEIGFSSRFTIFIVNLVQELSESATVKSATRGKRALIRMINES